MDVIDESLTGSLTIFHSRLLTQTFTHDFFTHDFFTHDFVTHDLMYGRPDAAGARTCPTRPATAKMVTTYGNISRI
jgi:hypothetical protein